jgi:hypothetical protein
MRVGCNDKSGEHSDNFVHGLLLGFSGGTTPILRGSYVENRVRGDGIPQSQSGAAGKDPPFRTARMVITK